MARSTDLPPCCNAPKTLDRRAIKRRQTLSATARSSTARVQEHVEPRLAMSGRARLASAWVGVGEAVGTTFERALELLDARLMPACGVRCLGPTMLGGGAAWWWN